MEKKKIWWKEAMPNAFEDSFNLSFNIKALMTSKSQSAVNPLLIYYCKSLFRCCAEHTYTSCIVCYSWWHLFFLSLTWHGHYDIFFYQTLFLLLDSGLHIRQNSRLHDSLFVNITLSAQYTYRQCLTEKNLQCIHASINHVYVLKLLGPSNVQLRCVSDKKEWS